jgi:hypothetical protein
MFCPKCAIEATEGQKFCKTCGTNLELVNNALGRGDDTLGQLRMDLDGLKVNLMQGGKSIGDAVRREAQKYSRHNWRNHRRGRRTHPNLWWEGVNQQNSPETGKIDPPATAQPPDPELYLPRPKEWLKYSRQHNLRDGLVSLLGGGAAGFVLYYLGQIVIHAGVLETLDSRYGVKGVDQVVAMAWLIALIPILKGFGQLLYAIFFAESIRSIARSYKPEAAPAQAIHEPARLPAQAAVITDPNLSPPASVTERTTNILDKSEPRMASESH